MRGTFQITLVKVFVSLVLLMAGAIDAPGSVPIDIRYGVGRNRVAMKLWKDAEDQLKKGDVQGAQRNVDAALRSDPALWPALYTRAKVFIRQHKYELAVQDCSEALRQNPAFIEAALLRASANAHLGRYADAMKEIDHVISIHPRSDAYARALSDRALLRAICPDPTFRNAQQAIKDATNACKLVSWQDEDMIDTLAVAYAAVGDFDSAVSYEEQALAIKGISPEALKALQWHLALFKQHRTSPSSQNNLRVVPCAALTKDAHHRGCPTLCC